MNRIEEIHSRNVIQALRLQSAQEQSAMHAVNLAVSRWSNVEVEAELVRALPSSSRSRWHAAAQDNFMAWLNAGGFAQQAPEASLADAQPAAADAQRMALAATPGCDCAV
jgi:hypothetical protein